MIAPRSRMAVLWLCLALVLPSQAAASCETRIGEWLDPANGKVLAGDDLLRRVAEARVVLLGEAHTSAAHHRWQAYTLAALHSRRPDMVVGFEMFPRRAQPALDAWVAGELDEAAFLERSNWRQVWGYDAAYYLPLLHFVRQHRLPAVALNVDRELVSRVGDAGWRSISGAERSGISDPAPAADAYRRSLARLYAQKLAMGMHGDENRDDSGEADLDAIEQSERFGFFVEAQLTWDRAMAEALAAAAKRHPSALVVGVAGRGHLEYGYGIPRQLSDLGIDDVAVLLPLDADQDCAALPAGLADAVFVVEAQAAYDAPPRPRLGVVIESAEGGVRVIQVVEGSVAKASGIREGDLVLSAAGFETRDSGELVDVVQRQAPGTWLPLTLRRGDEILDIVARFPQRFE